MHLSIVLQREVPDTETAQQLTDFVREKLQPYPDVVISANVNETIFTPEPPPP